MDYSLGIFTFLLSVTLVTSLSSSQLSNMKVTKEQMKVICSRSLDPPYCLCNLNLNSRIDKSNIQALAKSTIHLARVYANKTYTVIDSIINIIGEPKVIEKYQLCAQNYKEVIARLIEVDRYLASGDYRKMRIEIFSAIEKAQTCEEKVDETSKTITPIHDNNLDFIRKCSIIWSISNHLP
ncbi:pectinesterase inhibitor-like [Gastrolobium bilobum]|uniref:pectinesterase inhibitor-like n=1 Tax=Gastrolobium bilobum TaxID=150636 RepID=UPI002AAF323C|nr:pectinesterase inhibitor-like [Gastrolobium bilobum]